MKALMISIKPKWVAKILNGEKIIEVRKIIPKCNLPIDVYIYCTKDTHNTLHKNCANIYWVADTNFKAKNKKLGLQAQPHLNGKVVAKFTLNKIEHFEREYMSRYIDDYYYDNGKKPNKKFYKNTCLTEKELFDYIGSGDGYAWHISNLVIFDKPKELSEFRYAVCPKTNCEYCKYNKTVEGDLYCTRKALTKAPQNMVYIETEELKFGQLEDIEEELGIDLITLFKALRQDNIWVKEHNTEEQEIVYERIRLNFLNRTLDFVYPRKEIGKGRNLFDYGESWALTKEELL